MTLPTPLVSVIIAAYGQDEFLSQTLESLTSQTLTDWEAIIIDDGSPDNVAQTAAQWVARDKRIKFMHTPNRGVSAARNTAAAAATGLYMVALDGDDLIAPGYLQTLVDAMRQNPDIKAAFTQMQCFGEHNTRWPVFYDSYARLLVNNPLYVSGMVRLADFRESGGYDEEMHFGFEDWEFWIRFLKGVDPAKVYIGSDVMFFYRQKKTSRNTEAVARNIDRCNTFIYNAHREEYVRLFGKGMVTPQNLKNLEYWMLDYIADPPSLNRQSAANAASSLATRLKRIARCTKLSPEFQKSLLQILSRSFIEKVARNGITIPSKQNRLLQLAAAKTDCYIALMLFKQRLSPKNWFHRKTRQ